MFKPIFSIITYFLAQVIGLYFAWSLTNQSEIEISNEIGLSLVVSIITSIFGVVLIRWQVLQQAKKLQIESSIKPLQDAIFTIIPIFGVYQNYKNQEKIYQLSKKYSNNHLFVQLAGALAILQVILMITIFGTANYLQLPILILNILLDCYLMRNLLNMQKKHLQDSQS